MFRIDLIFETSQSDISMYLNFVPSNIPLPLPLSLEKESKLLTSISLKSIGSCYVPGPYSSYRCSIIFRNSSNDFTTIMLS